MSDKYMKNLTFANIAKACEGTYIGRTGGRTQIHSDCV